MANSRCLIAIVQADVGVTASDLPTAAFNLTALADTAAITLFWATLQGIGRAIPVFVCDAMPDQVEREFVLFGADLCSDKRVQVDEETWKTAVQQLLLSQPDDRDHVKRAVRCLRKMFEEDDVLDRFMAGWTGLETLNKALSSHYGISRCGSEEVTCPCCKHRFANKAAWPNAVKELFLQKSSEDIYDECRSARSGLVHGGMEIVKAHLVARTHVAEIARLLDKALGLVTGFEAQFPRDFRWMAGDHAADLVYVTGRISLPVSTPQAYEEANGAPLPRISLENAKRLGEAARITPCFPKGCRGYITGMAATGPSPKSAPQNTCS